MPALMIATTSANANGLRVGDVNNITKGAATYYHEPFRSVLEEATAFLRYFQKCWMRWNLFYRNNFIISASVQGMKNQIFTSADTNIITS